MRVLFYIAFTITALSMSGQSLELVTGLGSSLGESSGLLYLDGRIITHNDSSGEAELYELDSLTGEISRTIAISNATLVDWEDLAIDDEYIYIADSGNDDGSRQDLRIYRILISDYLIAETVTAEMISYHFSNQSDFSPQDFNTDYDVEAIIVLNDSLYLFSKNWTDQTCDIYALPTSPGDYSISPLTSFDSEGFITGATFDTDSNAIMLSGYDFSGAFVTQMSSLNFPEILSSTRQVVSPPAGYSIQIEAISPAAGGGYYLSSEDGFSGAAGLYRYDDIINTIDESALREVKAPYPNPCREHVQIDLLAGEWFQIRDIHGRVVMTGTDARLAMHQSSGKYLLLIYNQDNELRGKSELTVE